MAVPRPLRILIVDDDRVLNHEIETRLTKAGFLPEPVFDGKSALAKIDSNFDLIVLDLVMPDISGFDVLREIRNRRLSTPVIVLSLLRQEEDITRAKELGARECFTKSSINFMDDVVKYAEHLSIT